MPFNTYVVSLHRNESSYQSNTLDIQCVIDKDKRYVSAQEQWQRALTGLTEFPQSTSRAYRRSEDHLGTLKDCSDS